jgi:transcriptional regulator with XRE-family HTH domain
MKKANGASAGARRRIHRSASQWQALLTAQAQSGLSQQAFCDREGVSTASLSNWRRRVREGVPASSAGSLMPPAFIELTGGAARRPLDAGIKVRIELGAGVVLELSRA